MNPYLVAAIAVICGLVGIFFITYVLNKKTPLPKGCENLLIDDEACGACSNSQCDIKQKIDFKKIEEELKEEK